MTLAQIYVYMTDTPDICDEFRPLLATANNMRMIEGRKAYKEQWLQRINGYFK